MKHLVACLFILLTSIVLSLPSSAQPVTLSGYVQDAESGERLIGASLIERNTGAGTVTNRYGFFSMSMPPGPADIHVSFIGYRTDTLKLDLSQSTQVTLELVPVLVHLESVEVSANRITSSSDFSSIRIPIQQVQMIPALLGEVDLLKALQLLPGVKPGIAGTGNLHVRGGGPDQNLILLDGTTVFNVNHLFGFLSVFNTDAIKHVELIKGGFPARYGGRLSSVVEITMKEGNLRRPVLHGGVGFLTSRLTVEAPIWKDRTSFILSGRRTYFDLLARPFVSYEEGKPTAYFYDGSAKINHILSRRDRLYLSLYLGTDRFGMDFRDLVGESSNRLKWGNTTAAFRWNRLWSQKLFMNTTLTYSSYGLNVRYREINKADGTKGSETVGADYQSHIEAYGLRADADWALAPAHYARFGLGATAYLFEPGALVYHSVKGQGTRDTTLVSSSVRSLEWLAYVEDDIRVGRHWKFNLGLHAAAFVVNRRLYASVQPRVSVLLQPRQDWSLHASFATMQQHIHLLAHSSGLGLPMDLWVPATRRVRPQRAWQASLGSTHFFKHGQYELGIEGYFKSMDHLVAYHEGANYLTPGTNWEDKVTAGKGWSYGIEVLLRRASGRTTGWIGYTLARAIRKFESINSGHHFPDRFDRPNDISLVLSRRMNRRLDLSATWVYSTGNAVTLPEAYFYSYGNTVLLGSGHSGLPSIEDHEYYGGKRNNFRMPAYHRLDLSLTYFFVRREDRESALTVSLYNAYNRMNPIYLELEQISAESTSNVQLKGYALFPILPSVSYGFKF